MTRVAVEINESQTVPSRRLVYSRDTGGGRLDSALHGDDGVAHFIGVKVTEAVQGLVVTAAVCVVGVEPLGPVDVAGLFACARVWWWWIGVKRGFLVRGTALD